MPRCGIRPVKDIDEHEKTFLLADEIYEKLVYDAEFPHVSIDFLNDKINKQWNTTCASFFCLDFKVAIFAAEVLV